MSLAMSHEERDAFLSDVHIGIVSIPQSEKGPLTVPIWYDYTPDKKVRMITGRNSLKGRLLAQAGRISLCVQTETPPYRYVSVEGPFEISDSSPEISLAMAIRYLGEERGKAYSSANPDNGDSMIVSLIPETWFTVDYNKMQEL